MRALHLPQLPAPSQGVSTLMPAKRAASSSREPVATETAIFRGRK